MDKFKNLDNYEEKNGVFTLKDKIAVPTGRILWITRNVHTGKVTTHMDPNMFVTAGKVSLAASLLDPTKGMITYMALGTSAVAPALGDTDLGTEIFRKLISVRSSLNNVATFQTFFTTSEGNGTLREAGLFGDDASSIPGSGTLFCRSAINRVKSSSDTLTALWTVTIG